MIDELPERKKMLFFKPLPYIHYTPPKLTEGKEWYISYYVQNPESGKLKRFRIKCNREKNIRERRKAANVIIEGLSTRLAMGWSPYIDKKAPKSYINIFDALDTYLTIKTKETEENSIRSYKSFVKIFRSWLERHNFDKKSYCCSITKEVAMSFIGEVELKNSAKTYNNYVNFFKGLFNWMQEKGYVDGNPFDGIQKKAKRLTKKIRRLLTDEELARVFNYLKDNNPEYLAISLLCYCCLMRTKEIALLRCADIDIQKQVVHVDSSIAKNDNDSYRTIPNEVIDVFKKLDLSERGNYLFSQHKGYDFRPGKTKICSRKIAAYWSRIIREDCKLPMEVQFYSLKDTGITNYLGDGVPISFVQQQADHSSVAVTAIYVGRNASAVSELKKAIVLPK